MKKIWDRVIFYMYIFITDPESKIIPMPKNLRLARVIHTTKNTKIFLWG
jgi:capsule polysaccharide export protein KpsC/LpsZ